MDRKRVLFFAWVAVTVGSITTATAIVLLVIDIINQITTK